MLSIEEKIGGNPNEYGKLFADEFNLIVDNLDKLIEKSGNKSETFTRQVAKAIDDLYKGNIYKDVGTLNNLVLERNTTVTNIESYEDGTSFLFIPKYTNTGPVTITMNSLPAKELKLHSSDLVSSDLIANNVYMAIYNTMLDVFNLYSLSSTNGSNGSGNILFVVDSESIIDPANLTNTIAVTTHANCPDETNKWYVYTIFNGDVANGSNRTQYAIKNSESEIIELYVRSITDGVINPWVSMGSNPLLEASIINAIRGTASEDYDTFKKHEDIINPIDVFVTNMNQNLSNKALLHGDDQVVFKVADPINDYDAVNFNTIRKSYIQSEDPSSEDPLTTNKSVIISNHPNTPDSSKYWWIKSTFIGKTTETKGTIQFAVEYDPDTINSEKNPRVYVQGIYNGRVTSWNRVDNLGISELSSAKFTSSSTAPLNPDYKDMWFKTTTGSIYMFINNGIEDLWLLLQEITLANIYSIVPDSDQFAIITDTSFPIIQEDDQSDWVEVELEARNDTGVFGNILINDNLILELETLVERNETIVKIVTGKYNAAAILGSGDLMIIGSNANGQLGIDEAISGVHNWIETGITNAVDVSFGDEHILIALSDGTVLGAGSNTNGQLGLPLSAIYTKFTKLDLTNISKVFTSATNSFALTSAGRIMACGKNYYWSLGINNNETSVNDILPVTEWTDVGVSDVKKVSSSNMHTIILQNSGNLLGAGYAFWSQFGDSPSNKVDNCLKTFSNVNAGYTAKDIATGSGHSFLLTNDDKVYGTGVHSLSRLGTGTDDTIIYDWTLVLSNKGVINSLIDNKVGGTVLLSNGDVWFCGENCQKFPQTIPENTVNAWKKIDASNISKIVTSETFGIYLDSSNNLWGCGFNDDGTLGNLTVDTDSFYELTKSYIKENFKQFSGFYPVTRLDPGTRSLTFTPDNFDIDILITKLWVLDN